MTISEILTMTKNDLQIAGDTFDEYLLNLIAVAQSAIEREGVVIKLDSMEDCGLVVMYASYLYRKRASSDPVMPRHLRYALNNRLFSQKTKGGEGP